MKGFYIFVRECVWEDVRSASRHAQSSSSSSSSSSTVRFGLGKKSSKSPDPLAAHTTRVRIHSRCC